ncbi:MAG: toprim domain-containing protein, partial [Deltaproteobacteria bacterium]|nr:toprim domain-containing protein [Deltaproteobacteria bacterium]
HVELVSRAGAKELVFVFDGDEAGIRAPTRASEIAAAQGVPARVLVPPDGEDPDETVLRIGTAAFRDLVRAAQPALEFLLDRALADVGEGASIEARVKTVQAVSGIVKAAPPGLARELYVEKVAERLKAPVDAVRMAIERMPGPKGPDRQRPEPDPVEEFGDAPRAPPRAYEPRQGGNPQQNRQGQGQRGQEPQQPGQAMRQGGPNGAQQNSRDPRAPGPGSPGQRGMEPRTQNPQPSPNDAQQAKGYAPAPVVPPANRKVGLIDPRKAEAQAELSVVAQMLLHVDLCKLVDESGVAGEFRVAALREFAEGAFVAAREGMLDARALVAASEPELLRKALERSLDEAEKGRAEAPEQERTNLKNKLNRLKRQGFNVRNRRDAAEEVVGQRTTASADRPKSDQETGA